jgi:hypothetical protein
MNMSNETRASASRPSFPPGSDVDVFLCHASEDKLLVVRPLAREMRQRGLTVWVDEVSVRAGDSLPEHVSRALASCRIAVAVISPAFLKKTWPQRELYALTYRELRTNCDLIVPVRHEVTIDDLAEVFPLVAPKLSLSTAQGFPEIAAAVAQRLVPMKLAPTRNSDFDDLVGTLKEQVRPRPETRLETRSLPSAHRDAAGDLRCPRCGNRLTDAGNGNASCDGCGLVCQESSDLVT